MDVVAIDGYLEARADDDEFSGVVRIERSGELLERGYGLASRAWGAHRTGYGFEFEVRPDGDIGRYWKEGINVGVSAMLSHRPRHDVTFAVLSNRENGAWEPITTIETALRTEA